MSEQLTSFQVQKWKPFKDAIGGISKLFAEGILRLGEDGLRIRSMDSSNVMFVDFHMESTCFTQLHLGKENKLKTNLALLSQVLSKGKTEDIITVEYSTPAEVRFEGKKKTSFKIPSYDYDDTEGKRKDLKEKGFVCTFPTSLLGEWLEAVDVTGESTLYLTVTPEKIVCASGCYHAESDTKNKGWTEENLASEEMKIEHINTDTKEVMVWLSATYLTSIQKVLSLSDTCTVHFKKSHYPVVFEVREQGINVDIIMAPRVPALSD